MNIDDFIAEIEAEMYDRTIAVDNGRVKVLIDEIRRLQKQRRDEFAARAMQGLLAGGEDIHSAATAAAIAADALIAALES